MISITFITASIIMAVLIFIGYYFKQKYSWFSLAGGVGVLILGLLLFTSGLTIPSGEITTYNYNSSAHPQSLSCGSGDVCNTTMITVYTPVDDTSNSLLAWIYVLTGLFIVTTSAININEERYTDDTKF